MAKRRSEPLEVMFTIRHGPPPPWQAAAWRQLWDKLMTQARQDVGDKKESNHDD